MPSTSALRVAEAALNRPGGLHYHLTQGRPGEVHVSVYGLPAGQPGMDSPDLGYWVRVHPRADPRQIVRAVRSGSSRKNLQHWAYAMRRE